MAKQKKAVESPAGNNGILDEIRRYFGAFFSWAKPFFTTPLSDRKAFVIYVCIFAILSLPVFIKPLVYVPSFQFYFEGLGEYFSGYYHPMFKSTFLSEVDSLGYYAYMPSIILDHDLDFTNQFIPFGLNSPPTKKGVPMNGFSIGPALMWTPFFILGHMLAVFANIFGANDPLNGYSLFYELPCFFGTIFYGFLGILLTYRLCREFFDPKNSFYATIFILFATPIIFYIEFEPSMSHTLSYLTSVACIYFYLKNREKRSIMGWIIVGFFGGLTTVIRWQCATLIFFVISVDAVSVIIRSVRAKAPQLFFKNVIGWAICGVTAVLTFAPQVISWSFFLDIYTEIPQVTRDASKYLAPAIKETLFSTFHGLFPWTPIAVPALIGFLYFTRRKDPVLSSIIWLYFLSEIYFIGASDWTSGQGFGQRRLIETMLFVPFGIGQILEYFGSNKVWYRLTLAAGFFLVWWNAVFIYQWIFGFIPKGGALTLAQLTYDKFWVFPIMLQRMIVPITGLFNIW